MEPISESLFPKNASSFWSIFFQLEIIALLASVPIALIAAWPADLLFNVLIGGLALSPICLIFAGTQLHYLHQKMGSVHFDGETIFVYDKAHCQKYAAKLADCRWFFGSRTWGTVPLRGNLIFTGIGQSLLIVFPDSLRTPEYRVQKAAYAEGPAIVAVGLTPETRFQWTNILEQLNIEKDTRRESLSPPISKELGMLWAILALPISWFLGLWVSRGIHNFLTQWNVPADIASGISFPFFVPGVIYIVCILCAFPFLWRTGQDVHQVKRGKLTQWNAILRICSVIGVMVAGCWSMIGRQGWTEHSAIAATVVNIIMGIVILVAYWRLLATPPKNES